jgi:hypothetical protein
MCGFWLRSGNTAALSNAVHFLEDNPKNGNGGLNRG